MIGRWRKRRLRISRAKASAGVRGRPSVGTANTEVTMMEADMTEPRTFPAALSSRRDKVSCPFLGRGEHTPRGHLDCMVLLELQVISTTPEGLFATDRCLQKFNKDFRRHQSGLWAIPGQEVPKFFYLVFSPKLRGEAWLAWNADTIGIHGIIPHGLETTLRRPALSKSRPHHLRRRHYKLPIQGSSPCSAILDASAKRTPSSGTGRNWKRTYHRPAWTG
ncbi:hypothetical protein BKA93DRAFT_746605 [Sparassis latifolia]